MLVLFKLCSKCFTCNTALCYNAGLIHFSFVLQLWILPAFGCRPQYDNGLEEEIFGFSIWTTVLNFAIPLNLFYRMHSVASLFEVFRHV